MINKSRLIRLTQKLIQIDSQNPGADEQKIALFVKKYLNRLGVKPKLYAFKKNRTNIIAELKNKGSKKSLLITPHLDTVPAGKGWRFSPFEGRIYQGRIYGLGATDCKGNLAASLEVINSLVEDRVILDYKLIFSATAEEESGSSLGLIALLKKKILKPDLALVLDADDFDIVVAQKGLIHLKVKLKGKRAHGAYPQKGENAIDLSLKILGDIKEKGFFSFQGINHRYLLPPTVNIGTIRGGDKVNVVADWCEFGLDFRFLPGMQAKEILHKLDRIIRKYTKKYKIEIEGIQQPYTMQEAHPLVTRMLKAMKKFKLNPKICGSEGATTITFFQDQNIPAIATGFGVSGCAHTIDEYIKIDNLYKGTLALEEFLKNYKFAG